MINKEQIVKEICTLKTLVIPCIDNGLPYVRLDLVADILMQNGIDATNLYDRVKSKTYTGGQEDVH